jgi:hypothetical protein
MARRAGETEVHAINEFRGRIPSLPPVKSVNTELYMGPTEESNWVIYGHLLVGAYPASTNDIANAQLLTSILRLGVTTFVCLQQEYQHEGVTETQWRSGEKLRPYIFDAIRLVDSLPDSFFSSTTVRGLIPRGKPDGLEFVHFPIVDCSIANDASVLQLCHDLSQRLLKGEVMYLHCWGGHGRTGTVVSIMLGLLYGLSPLDAMRWVQFCHDLRVAPMGTASPQTETQRQQVIRVLNAVRQAQIVHSGVSSGAGASGYASSSNNNGVNPEVVVKNPRSPRALLSPQPAVSGARPGSLSMALPQNHHHHQQQQSKHSHIADNTTTTTTSSSSVSSHVLNADANSGESSSTSSQKGTDQPQRASAAALAAASIPRTAQTAQPKPRSGSVPLRNTNTQVSMARSPVASWQTGTKTTNNQASTRIRRLSSEQSSGQTNQGSNSSSSSHPSPLMSSGVTIGGNVTDSKNTSSTSTRNSTSTSSSNSNNTAVIMSHLSPRPEAVVSVNNFTSSDAKSGQGGNQGQNQGQFSPSAVREAILTDPRATSVAPLASSTATVLGLGPLLAANRSSIVFSSTSTATSNTTTTSTGGGSTTNINTIVTNRPSDVTTKERDIHRNFDGKNDESERNDGNKNNLQENNSSNDAQQQIMRPSSADAAIQSRRSVSSTLSFNPSNTNSNINPIANDHQTNTSNIDTIQQTNSATSINTHSTTPSNTTIDASSTRDTTDKLIAQTQAHIRSSRTSPGFGGAQQTNLLSSSQSNTNTSQQTTTSSPRSPVPGGYSSRAYGYSAVAAASGGGGGHFSQSQTNNSTPPRGSGGGGGGSSQIHQQNVTSSVSSSPRSSAAAAGLASAIAAYSVSVSTATSPGQGSTQVPRSRLAIARQQSREPHTISQSLTSNGVGVGTPLLAAALGGSTSESFDKKTSTSPSPSSFFSSSSSATTTVARNALFRSPAPPLDSVTSSSSSYNVRPNTVSPIGGSSLSHTNVSTAPINLVSGRPRVRIVVRGET